MTTEEREELIEEIALAMVDGFLVVSLPLAVQIADRLIEAGYVKKPF